MRIQRSWLPAVCLAALLAGPAAALEVKLTVKNDAKLARKAGTVTSGVPFAKGTLKDVKKLSVLAGGKVLPAQFTKLAVWNDGSIRWALMDTQVDLPAGGKTELVVRDDGRNKAPAKPVKVAESDAGVTVTTGPLVLVIDKKKPGLIRSIKVNGQERITSKGRGVVLFMPGEATQVEKEYSGRPSGTWKVNEYGPGKPLASPAPSEVTIEQAGPLRAVVCVRGKFPGVHKGLLSYTARISAFAGQGFVKVHYWLENNGGMGYHYSRNSREKAGNMEWFVFDGLALELGLGLGGTVKAECEDVSASGRFKVFQTCLRNKDNRKLKRNDYLIYQTRDFKYTISGGDSGGTTGPGAGKQLKTGERSDGVVKLTGSAGQLTTAIRGFWENYEKAIELDGDKLRLWLWPTEGQWPRLRPGDKRPNHYITGLFDKPLGSNPRYDLYCLPGAVHKGHEIILDFSERPGGETSAELSRPLFALALPRYYAATEAAPAIFTPPDIRTDEDECNQKLDAWMRMTRSVVDPQSKTGLFEARKHSPWVNVRYYQDSLFWFGWMDYGDISVPGYGPTGLEYDWLWIMMLNAMRTGDPNFMRWGIDMARHRIDVDQLWSDRDPPQVRGLQRGGPKNFPTFHCDQLCDPPGVKDNHLAGVALYYMLTGEPKALECCKRNAEGLKVSWAQIMKKKHSGNMAANAWAIHAYCAMYDLTADSKWLDEALGLFGADVTSLWKQYGPHLHNPRRQIRSQTYAKEDIKYCASTYALCLLHHRTKDKKLLKLLIEGCDKDFPATCHFDAPLFLADLHAYVALVTGKKDYAEDAVEHWIEASSESRCPPVFLPKKNSDWSQRSAMHLRAGHLLQYYFWKKSKR